MGERIDCSFELRHAQRPEVVAQVEFLEWTGADRLRHSKFVGLREDKNPRNVVKEA